MLAICVQVGQAQGGEAASPWDGDARSAMRLIAGSSEAPIAAGIEIRIQPGWHTYWRYPGDAGVPPRFDFAGSRNLESATVQWPVPRRIEEQGLTVIGYTSDVIFPLVVVPQHRGEPVTVRLKLEYAVCEKLCVPAEATAELVLAVAPSPYDETLAQAQSRVPRKRALGEGGTLAIRALRRDETHRRAIVDVAVPHQTDVELFAEGPTAAWALPIPVRSGAPAAGVQRFVFDLDGAPPGASYAGTPVTLTAAAGGEAIEVTAPLE
ncbi:MAG TPA: protein-disulfide reductase DsbD domain-containing protein [Xanthobacteraceae bacterium]